MRLKKTIRMKLLMCFVLSVLLSGCTVNGSGQPENQFNDIVLEDGVTFGQTFLAKHNGFQQINIFLQSNEPGNGNIVLYFRENSFTTENIEIVKVPISEISNPGFYSFELSSPLGSYLKRYYVLIDFEGSGSVIIGSAPEDSYLNGVAYAHGFTIPRQLTFSLSYSLKPLFFGLIKDLGVSWITWIFASLLLYILPGYVLINKLLPTFSALRFFERIIFSIAVSISIYPILMVWTNLVNLNIGIFYAIIPVLLSIGILAIDFLRKPFKVHFNIKELINWKKIELVDGLTLVVILLIIFVRFWVIRSLPAPMWGDSYQHTIITQLLNENKGLFTSWEPYAEISRFTYHFGFHANTVVFKWLTGLSSEKAVLVVGQIMNTFAVLVLYPFAVFLSPKKSKWAGLITIIIAGFVLNTPMFYTNWGRYTQLMGQVLLIPLVLFVWKFIINKEVSKENIFVSSLLVAGLAYSHYRVAIMYILFVILKTLINLKNTFIIKNVKSMIIIHGIGLILFLPWFINSLGGNMIDMFVMMITRKPTTPTVANLVEPITKLSLADYGLYTYIPKFILFISVMSIIFLLVKKNKKTVFFTTWWVAIFIVGFPQFFLLPGKDIISEFTVLISLYIPISVIIGSSLGEILIYIIQKKRKLSYLLILLIFLGSFFFLKQRFYDLNEKVYSLVTYVDKEAMDWVIENIPRDSKFYVNNFTAFDGAVIVGSDAGWWLPFYSKNKINVPPINYGFEESINVRNEINEFSEYIRKNGFQSDIVSHHLLEAGFEYIYIGQKQGLVNSHDSDRIIAEKLLSNKHYSKIYQNDNVIILKINR